MIEVRNLNLHKERKSTRDGINGGKIFFLLIALKITLKSSNNVLNVCRICKSKLYDNTERDWNEELEIHHYKVLTQHKEVKFI